MKLATLYLYPAIATKITQIDSALNYFKSGVKGTVQQDF
jgi:hypothetical protein